MTMLKFQKTKMLQKSILKKFSRKKLWNRSLYLLMRQMIARLSYIWNKLMSFWTTFSKTIAHFSYFRKITAWVTFLKLAQINFWLTWEKFSKLFLRFQWDLVFWRQIEWMTLCTPILKNKNSFIIEMTQLIDL